MKQKLIKCVDKSQSAIILLYTNTGIRVFHTPRAYKEILWHITLGSYVGF